LTLSYYDATVISGRCTVVREEVVEKREDVISTLPTLLRTIREALALSQEMIAEKSGVTRQLVSRWECGHSLPSKEQLDNWLSVIETQIRFQNQLRGCISEIALIRFYSDVTERMQKLISCPVFNGNNGDQE
jgi:DNA-binding transcriptional regulator YiaG